MNLEKIKNDFDSKNYDIVMRDSVNQKWTLLNDLNVFENTNILDDKYLEVKSVNKKDRLFLDNFLEDNSFLFEVQYEHDDFKKTKLGFEFLHNYNENNKYELIDNPFVKKAFKISDEIEEFLISDLGLKKYSNPEEFDSEEYLTIWYYDIDRVKVEKPYFIESSIEDIEYMGFEVLDEKDFIKNKELEF